MKKIDAGSLLKKYKLGKCTQEEKDIVESWYVRYNTSHADDLSEHEIQKSLARISSKLRIKKQNAKIQKLWPQISAAVAVLIMIVMAGLFYSGHLRFKTDDILTVADLAPGTQGATLTLANGKKIDVSEAKAGELVSIPGVNISKTEEGLITYTISDSETQNSKAINTLETSKGQQVQVRLPDGTLVHLNAASSLKYPSSFTKLSRRIVELSGEAFFEVSKDKLHPFIVKADGHQVEVLGTHFNMDCYPGSQPKTTLVEGSVKISNHAGISKILEPGQQAKLSNAKIDVALVDIEYAVAWKDGYFKFDNTQLSEIVQQLSRWYDFETDYTRLPHIRFSAEIPRNTNLSTFIKLIESNTNVHFILKDSQKQKKERRLEIMK